MKLSILIPSLYKRIELLHTLMFCINNQDGYFLNQTEVLVNMDSGITSVGLKRNKLLHDATGEYLVFVDDDDIISTNYLEQIFSGINKEVDHIGICMMYQPDNGPERKVLCSKDYAWQEKNGVYLRSAQHVCPIKSEIAKKIKFPELNFGEDKIYSDQVNKLIVTEHLITEPIYFYKFRSNKTI